MTLLWSKDPSDQRAVTEECTTVNQTHIVRRQRAAHRETIRKIKPILWTEHPQTKIVLTVRLERNNDPYVLFVVMTFRSNAPYALFGVLTLQSNYPYALFGVMTLRSNDPSENNDPLEQ